MKEIERRDGEKLNVEHRKVKEMEMKVKEEREREERKKEMERIPSGQRGGSRQGLPQGHCVKREK